jgi:hypothetical protein
MPQPLSIGMVPGRVEIRPAESWISLIVSRIVPITLRLPIVAPGS